MTPRLIAARFRVSSIYSSVVDRLGDVNEELEEALREEEAAWQEAFRPAPARTRKKEKAPRLK